MKEVNIKEIIEKYKSGNSSLKEEAFLFDNVDESQHEIKTWASFVKRNKKVAPDNFNDALWESFDKKTTKNNRFKIAIMSAAASILLISTLYLNNIRDKGLSNSEKEALLNEAKSMFTEYEQTKPTYKIIAENDFIIVYTKTE